MICYLFLSQALLPVADPERGGGGGGGRGATALPAKIWSTGFFKIPFCIRMLKNKAQIAQETKKP